MTQATRESYLPPFQSLLSSSKPEVGSKCEIRQYERTKNAKGEIVLLKTGTARSTLGKKPRDDWSAQAALVLTRHSDDKDCNRTELEVQSPYIKAALKECVPEFSNFDLERQTIVIKDEPRCVFHYRHDLARYHDRCAETGQTDAKEHVAFILDYMFRTLDREIRHFTRFMENPVLQPSLEFVNLWMVFVPGQLVYVERKCGLKMVRGRVFRLKSIERCPCTEVWCPKYPWSLQGCIIDYDGDDFGHVNISATIEPYEGVKALRDLLVIPLRYHPDPETLQRELVSRGKRFLQLSGRHYMAYKGTAELMSNDRDCTSDGEDDFFPLRSTHVDGRIMIDCSAFSEARPSHQPTFRSSEKIFRVKFGQHLKMSDEEYMICENVVAGYSLNDKKWGWFEIEAIQDIEFNESAFDALIFEEGKKKMLLSLVKTHATEKAGFDDVIKGKGKGLIVLLHGEAGTGKTLTAESIADYTRAPLLKLDAGTLGSNASELEESLRTAFRIAEQWSAVTLLDEADVFLEQRGHSDMERNRLVAVFLRALEYFTGVLFLTTNRVRSFDHAFKSRIHLGLFYPPLGPSSRRQVWRTLLSRPGLNTDPQLLDSDLPSSGDDAGLNGRQIKNAVQIASALAFGEGVPINKGHLQLAIATMNAFDTELDARIAESQDGNTDEDPAATPGTPARKRRRLEDNV